MPAKKRTTTSSISEKNTKNSKIAKKTSDVPKKNNASQLFNIFMNMLRAVFVIFDPGKPPPGMQVYHSIVVDKYGDDDSIFSYLISKCKVVLLRKALKLHTQANVDGNTFITALRKIFKGISRRNTSWSGNRDNSLVGVAVKIRSAGIKAKGIASFGTDSIQTLKLFHETFIGGKISADAFFENLRQVNDARVAEVTKRGPKISRPRKTPASSTSSTSSTSTSSSSSTFSSSSSSSSSSSTASTASSLKFVSTRNGPLRTSPSSNTPLNTNSNSNNVDLTTYLLSTTITVDMLVRAVAALKATATSILDNNAKQSFLLNLDHVSRSLVPHCGAQLHDVTNIEGKIKLLQLMLDVKKMNKMRASFTLEIARLQQQQLQLAAVLPPPPPPPLPPTSSSSSSSSLSSTSSNQTITTTLPIPSNTVYTSIISHIDENSVPVAQYNGSLSNVAQNTRLQRAKDDLQNENSPTRESFAHIFTQCSHLNDNGKNGMIVTFYNSQNQ